MKESACLLNNNGPFERLFNYVFGVLDGGRLPCVGYINTNIQNFYYEGYPGNVDLINLVIYNFRGEAIHAAFSCSGFWHESKVSNSFGLMRKYLSDSYDRSRFLILADSAFVLDITSNGKNILRALKSNKTQGTPKFVDLSAVDLMERVMPCKLQAAERGIRASKK